MALLLWAGAVSALAFESSFGVRFAFYPVEVAVWEFA
jgi:hypothetical protein